MKLLFTAADTIKIGFYQSIPESYDIPAECRNIHTAPLAGILPPGQVWPELWVNEDDFDHAVEILTPYEIADNEN